LFLFQRNIFFSYNRFYVAPEILVDDHKHGLPVDVWSLGVLLYYAMMKVYPFVARNPHLMVPAIVSGRYQPIPPTGKGGIYSQELIDVINSMLVVVCFLFIVFFLILSLQSIFLWLLFYVIVFIIES
jgi:serine/threonine protein kinase